MNRKVAFDITVLINAEVDLRARTGVFRFVSHLARLLAKNFNENFYVYINSKFSKLSVTKEVLNKYGIRSENVVQEKAGCLLLDENGLWDIFSPFHPFPSFSNANIVRGRYLVIYDLLPIEFPSFFVSPGNNLIFEILDSVTEDTVLFAISNYTAESLMKWRKNLKFRNLHTVFLSVDESLYNNKVAIHDIERIGEKYAFNGERYILALATHEPRKNLEGVIRAFCRYSYSNRDRKTILAIAGGSGWGNSKLNRLINRMSKYFNIRVLGFVSESDLPILLSGAAVFVYPSFGEGFGLPPLEALKCGVPVISSGCGALRETIGEGGIIVDPSDILGIADAINRILNDYEYRDHLKIKGTSQSLKFMWEDTNQIILKAMEGNDEICKNFEIKGS